MIGVCWLWSLCWIVHWPSSDTTSQHPLCSSVRCSHTAPLALPWWLPGLGPGLRPPPRLLARWLDGTSVYSSPSRRQKSNLQSHQTVFIHLKCINCIILLTLPIHSGPFWPRKGKPFRSGLFWLKSELWLHTWKYAYVLVVYLFVCLFIFTSIS